MKKSPNIWAWIVQKNANFPAVETVKFCVVVHGPVQVGCSRPGRLNVRLWSVPASVFWNTAVTLVPTRTWTSDFSNERSCAVIVMVSAGAGGGVEAGTGVGAGVVAGVATAVGDVVAVGEPAVVVAAVGEGTAAAVGMAVGATVPGAVAIAGAGVGSLEPPPHAAARNKKAAEAANRYFKESLRAGRGAPSTTERGRVPVGER